MFVARPPSRGGWLGPLAAVGLAGPFARLGVPLGIVPFNATVLLVLLALRQRAHDLRPKSVDFLPALPHTGSGKIYKKALRDPYWIGRQRKV